MVSVPARTHVAESIETLLSDLGLGPGDRLPSERAMAEGLGVSRPALREALRTLIDGHMLEARRGAGTFLVGPDLRDLTVVRQALEPLAARLAAQRATDGERAEIARLTARLAGALRDPRRFAAVDLDLHRALARASHNAVLLGCLEGLERMLRLSRAQTAGDPATRRATLEEMQRLNDAIAGRGGDQAETAMAAHLSRIAGQLNAG